MVKIQDASASSVPAMDDPDAASLEAAAMKVPVTVWLGPMGPLLWKLHSLMAPGQSLAPALLSADDIRFLNDGLKDLCISLKNMSEREVDASFMARWWMKIVRELCYDTEDHLDEVVYDGARAHHRFSWLFAREKDNFSGLLARARDASESLECVKWPPKAAEPDWGQTGVGRLTSLHFVHVEPQEKLVELLDLDDDDDKKTLKVVPITGCAGVGKTTIARALYHRHAWKFRCRAFVTVSRNPDMRGFLTSMLSQIKAPPPHGFPDVPDLIEAISKHLHGKRYLIVIDDLWTASVWSIISRGFPRGDHCSRIITITEIDDVALACCSYDSDYIYKMEPLNDHESRKLFFSRVFGSEDGCPTDIKEISYEIIRKCGGLPLVIVSIASLLATESSIEPEKWKHIHDFLSFSYFVEEEGKPTDSRGWKTNRKSPAVSVSPAAKDNLGLPGHGMSSGSTEIIDVLNLLYNRLAHLMYKSLPPRMRTCLLYLSMYAHGYVIKKDELVKQWVAEGFLSAVGGRDTEEIAGGYFDELVSRGIIQAMETDYNGEVLSCTVHQMVLDFIRHKCMEENFIITVDYFQSTLALPDKVRLLSVQFGGVETAYIPETIVTSQVRSLIFWGFLECVPSIADYKLLRVLILHIWADQGKTSFDLTRIGELFGLKYIKIECNIAVKLPGKIQGLQHLETLHVDARLSVVPSDIVNLKRLLHICLPSEYILPNVVAHMISLRTLRYFDIGSQSENNVLHLGRLTNLQDLQLICSRVRPAEKLEKNVQLLGLILEKLSVLRSVTLVPAASGSFCVNIPEDGFRTASPPLDLLLRRIELSRRCCIFFSLPKWFGELRRLCILKIAIRELSMNDADVLKGLPALAALTLYIQTVSEEKIVIHEGGFQALMYFKFMCDAPRLSFVQGAMPGVQKLKIRFNSNKWREHTFGTAGFCHLTGLTEVSVKFGARGASEFNIKAAESALEAAVKDHPNSPTTRVQLVDVISYGKEMLQEIRDGKRKKMERLDEKRHEGGKKRKMEWLEEYVNKPSVDSRYGGTCCVFTPLTHQPQSVDMVTGAMGSLLPKLLDLLEDEYNLEAKVKDDIKSLYKELESMQDDLWIVAKLEPPQLDLVTSMWAKEVRDFSYDAEDVIDSLLVLVEGSWAGIGGLISWIAEWLSTRKARHVFASTINGITRQAQNLKALGCQMPLVAINSNNPIAANPNAATSGDPHIISMYVHLKKLVGINVFMDEVIKKLTHETDDGSKQLKIVSIVGMGGLGKTTLAKAVYDKIRVQYDFTAFISVSRHPDMRKVYMDILFQIGKQSYMNHNLAEYGKRQLIGEVTALLANKRYLIVFDDIWDVNSWEVIKSAMIDSGLGSRVVTTTRISEVTANAGDVYKLKVLSDSHSEELFNARLFGGKDNVPCVVPKVPEKLLQKCGGVPLAIITMAGLLVGTPRNEWSRVYNSIGFGSEVGGNIDVDNARKILLSSYYDLPYHLRACLLYLHSFPEGRLIEKETLIWKWAAEGLIVEEPGTVLFELGEGYFEELIKQKPGHTGRGLLILWRESMCP